jgi:hypothetical protein
VLHLGGVGKYMSQIQDGLSIQGIWGSTMIIPTSKSGNIVTTYLEEPSLAFFVGGAWQSNAPPQKWKPGCVALHVDLQRACGVGHVMLGALPRRVILVTEK